MNQYTILLEDDDIIVVNKLAPIPVQRDKSGDASLQELLEALVASSGLSELVEAAHRVDRRTSGIVVFAKNRVALRALDAAFRERAVKKTYVACVERAPEPPEGKLEHNIYFDRRSNISRALPPAVAAAKKTADRSGASMARLEYRLVCASERYFFLDIQPETGRHHQIRAQLAAIACPIRGDLKYGARRSCKSGRIMLHARSLEFTHPKTGLVTFVEAPFPDDEALWAAYKP